MNWKFSDTWGIPELEDANEFLGTVGMTMTENGMTNTRNLERLELQQANRVLGVRLPMYGNMKVEYKCRCKQIRELSKKVLDAPLSQWDLWIVYKSRYKAIIRYLLPVTLFNDKQCNEI